MNIDFNQPILDAAGEPMKGEDGVTATLATAATTALFGTLRGDETQTGAQKAELGVLGLKLHAGGSHDLRAEDVALLKDRIGRSFGPLIVARAWALLDPPPADATA